MRTATQWLRATTATVFLLSCGALPSGTLSGTADESTANDAGDLTASELPGDALGDTLPDAFSDIWTVTDAVDEVLGEVITTDIAAADIAPDATTTACFCGDSICSTIPCGETVETCPADCKGCGNGICEPGEGPKSCAIDCCGTCGDGKCKGYDCGESSDTCAKDCGSACGNKVCDKGESPQSCAQDCVWQACGNGVCEASDGGPTKCPEDCGNACGDGVCQGGEDFIACPIDCGYCGDGFCSVKIGESTANCMADCKGGECDPNLPSDVTKCDDGNPCTLETCPPAGVCHHPPIPGPCDDGSLCTTGDHCQFGACVLTNMLDCSDGNPCTADLCDPKTGCQHAPVGGACTDGDACTVGDSCKNGGCSSGVALTCDDGNACTNDSCAPASGCTATDDDQNSCIDGNLCTIGDHCLAGVCTGAGDLGCDDGNPCTNDVCAPESGCAHLPNSATCSDGNACTTGDGCINAVCTPGSLVDCNDQNPCTADGCNIANGCTHKATSAACDDNNPCTISDACKGGSCQGGPSLDCDDGNVCTKDSCDVASGCTSTSDEGAACSDGDVCSTGDSCEASACVAGSGLPCDDGNPCTLDGCNAGAGCTHKALSGACEDGNPCTKGDQCFNAVCMPGPGLDCTDGNSCTLDACDNVGGCKHSATTGACTDGNACTIGDLCKTGDCQPGGAMDCGDGNPCTDDSCSATTGCVHLPGTATCEDGNSCTVGDLCANTVCTPGGQVDCNDNDPCTSDACQSATGCVHKATSGTCDDGDPCTVADSCKNGVCHGGGAASCDDGNACTFDQCDSAKGCFSVAADGNGCSDGNVCTVNDSCTGGFCQSGAASGCDDGNPCTADSCDAQNGCAHVAASGGCDDGSACTLGDTCWNGACTGGSPRDCSDNDPCTTDACDAKSGCKYGANTAPCSDNNACTLGDVCGNGGCQPGSLANCGDGNPCTDDGCNAATGCTHLANAATCTDNNACSAGDACQGGSCLPGGLISCDDEQPCTADSCSPQGGCQHKAQTAACDDGNPCTSNDTCSGGSCKGGPALVCDDGNVCTTDSCSLASGCTSIAADGATCSDGDVCTSGDACQAAACVGGSGLACDDGNPCTLDGCNAGAGCTHKALSGACEDGNPCTTGDACFNAICLPGPGIDCADGNPCTLDACDTSGGCQHTATTGACTDSNACTVGDVCAGGSCQPGKVFDCGDGNPCTDDSCSATTGCTHLANAATCTDSNVCTNGDACQGGTCLSGAQVGCDDGEPCTIDSCDPVNSCQHTPTTGPCNDGDLCTTEDTCAGGSCAGKGVLACDDSNTCTLNQCNSGSGCWFPVDSAGTCSDGNACTIGDHCAGGTCLYTTTQGCDDGLPCTVDSCATASGCVHTAASNGAVCDDGNLCTTGDNCQASVCVKAGDLNCEDGLACTTGSCVSASGCVQLANSATCSDGNPCTLWDHCAGGQCVPTSLADCDDKLPCTADSCNPVDGTCVHAGGPMNGNACSDGSLCTPTDSCLGGICVGSGTLTCDDSNTCTDDACVAASGCVHTARTGSCEDGNKCTTNDACQGGICSVTAVVVCNDGNACTSDSCDPTTGDCVFNKTTFNGNTCSDGDLCTQVDTCSGGNCVGSSPKICAAIDPCHVVGTCASTTGVCSNPNKTDGTGCDDNNACTLDDVCSAGVCSGPTAADCNDHIACTQDSCTAAGGCTHLAAPMNGLGCDDGNKCTQVDSCLNGNCIGGSPRTCTALDQCHLAGSCDPVGGLCSNPNQPDATTCVDGSACTITDRCLSGVCTGTGALDCSDIDPCTNDTCVPASGCAHSANTGNACDDANQCTSADTCHAGTCYGVANGCTDANDCTTDSCVGKTCSNVYNSNACQDGDACTLNDSCFGGACKAGTPMVCTDNSMCTTPDYCLGGNCFGGPAISCDDGNQCTVDSCDAGKGCQYASTTAGSGCGDYGTCGGGQCACPGGFAIQGLHCQPVLSGITLSGGTLSPTFAAGVTSYAATVPLATASSNLTVTAPSGVSVTLSINGGAISTLMVGQPTAVALRLGQSTLTLTAIHAGMSKLYTVVVTRLPTVQQAYAKRSQDYYEGCGDSGTFGAAMAFSGDTLVIGDPNVCGAAGHLTVYQRIAGVWQFQTLLYAPQNLATIQHFGASVAIDGDVIVAGAPEESSRPASNAILLSGWGLPISGAAHVFIRQDGQWSWRTTLKASNAAANARFGSAVAISGSTIAVGASQESSDINAVGAPWDNGAANSGAVYVFTETQGLWTEQAYLKASNAEAGDQFGAAVAVSGESLLIGAPGEDSKAAGVGGNATNNSSPDAGAAYVLTRTNGAWTEQAYLKASNPDAADAFGGTVAISGDIAAVGAVGEDGNGKDPLDNSRLNSGAAYAFTRAGGGWSQEAYLKMPAADTGDAFGASLALDGGALLVGAPHESSAAVGLNGDQSDNSHPDSGAAFLFARQAGVWSLSAYIKAANSDANDLFGTAVTLHANTAVVGAPGEAGSGLELTGDPSLNDAPGSGAAYAFSGDVCFLGQTGECDDGNSCTTDFCDVNQFCQHTTVAVGTTCALSATCQATGCTCPTGYMLWSGACRPLLSAFTALSGTSFDSWAHDFVTSIYNTLPVTATVTATALAPSGVTLSMSVNGGAPGAVSTPFPAYLGDTLVRVVASGLGMPMANDLIIRRPVSETYAKASNLGYNGLNFGRAIAVDGDTVVVGASDSSCATGINGNEDIGNCYWSGSAYVFVCDSGGTWTQQAYLKAPNTDAQDYFGSSVALSGDTIVIGAAGEDGGGTGVNPVSDNSKLNSGAAYVFVRDPVSKLWSQQAYLKASTVDASDGFGTAVAITGNTIVVGAPGEDSGSGSVQTDNAKSGAGAAYTFTRTGVNWTQQSYIKPTVINAGDAFGSAVAISGSWLAIGAPSQASGTGAVYTFNNLVGWTQASYLKAGNGAASDSFGQSVAISGTTLVIGASGEDSNAALINGTGTSADNSASASGAAYVYIQSGITWVQQAFLKASNVQAGDGFGYSVGVSGDTVVVSAPYESGGGKFANADSNDNSASGAGASYVFFRNGTTWSQQGYLKATNTEADDIFGQSAAVSGTRVVVGAGLEDSAALGIDGNANDNSNWASGAAYFFVLNHN